jgi:hypothetical protein
MSDDQSNVGWSRKPYTITYLDLRGEKNTIRRVPPPKLHDMLPTDKVELRFQKNADFLQGDQFEIKHINPRHPNVLQLVNDEEATTFVDYYQTELQEEVAQRPGISPMEHPNNTRYLMWP